MIPRNVLSLFYFSLHLCCLAGLFSIGSEYSGGRGIEYEYDALNRISEIYEAPSGGGRSLFAKYFYHGPGLRVARRDMIGAASEADPTVRLSASYDAAGRPLESSFTQRPASGANGLLELSFGWDAAWSQSRRQAAWAFGSAADLLERERTFTYDPADRLTGGALRAPAAGAPAGAPAGSGTPAAFSRVLDAAGNRDSDFVVGDSNTYVRPQATPSVDFIYDSNGNLLNEETVLESGGAGNGQLAYNWRNQLASHTQGGVGHFSCRYDALGRLIAKKYNASLDSRPEMRWAWDGWRAIEEKRQNKSSWVTEATWVYGNGLDETLSMRRDALDASGAPAAAGEGDGAAEDYFLLADAQNTVWGLANASGALVERYEYNPEGAPSIFTMAPGAAAIGYGGGAVSGPGAGLPAAPAAVSPYRNARLFTGRDYDADTGLYYHRLRWYSPALGRFVSRDPLGAWGDPSALGNAYTYSANSPWTYSDPLGLWIADWARTARKWMNRNAPENIVGHTAYGVTHFLTDPLLLGEGAANISVNADRMDALDIGLESLGEVGRAAIITGVTGAALGKALEGYGGAADAARSCPMARANSSLPGKGAKVGGAYDEVPAAGGEVHHIPADSVSPISKGKGPAIRMERPDHRQTGSWGRSKAAQEYRAKQAELIRQGRFRDAQQMDIDDIRSKFGGDYDEGLQQMQDYTDTIKSNQVNPSNSGE